MHYPRIGQFKTVAALRQHIAELDLNLPVDDEVQTVAAGSPLAERLQLGSLAVGNRWCIHPMEGWDANDDGSPSELTLRRWQRFGQSGAKLIWGGEAAAVQPDGRANPRQTLATPDNRHGLAQLLAAANDSHRIAFGSLDGFAVGLQLTHSGRFCRPNDKRVEPRIAYHHPLLDARFGIDPQDDSVIWTDDELERLIDSYVQAAGVAREVGFQFVDVKACHGYLVHEFLSARDRPGRFGGDFANRTRLLTTIIRRIRQAWPDLEVVVRLSVFDAVPVQASRDIGQPMAFKHLLPYRWGFGLDVNDPLKIDLSEPIELLRQLQDLGVAAVNLSCGSPYYNPHLMRPAAFPPSDGYQPPEDPLVGVARQIEATRQCKQAVPGLPLVGSGYSYLQDYLPHVAQAVMRSGWVDAVGLGRMVLSYPTLPADTLQTGAMQRKLICRTFSDCTTAPRNGLVSGCYPLDAFYKQRAEMQELRRVKNELN